MKKKKKVKRMECIRNKRYCDKYRKWKEDRNIEAKNLRESPKSEEGHERSKNKEGARNRDRNA